MKSPAAEGKLLPYLDTFARAAQTSNFSEAAKSLGLTQAAVSQRIQALEKILDQPLFHRHAGRVILSPAGKELYNYAQKILNLHEEARQKIAGLPWPLKAELSLAASSIPGEHLLPLLLADFRKKYPHVKVRVTIGDSRQVLAKVEKGDAALGLVGQRSDKPHLDFRFLASDRMILVVRAKHPLAKKKTITTRQLIRLPLMVREIGSGMRHSLEGALEKAGLSLADCKVVLELGSNEAIKEAVLRGAGVAVLSQLAVQKEIRSKHLSGLTIADLDLERKMFIVSDRRRALPTPASQFLDFLTQENLATLRL